MREEQGMAIAISITSFVERGFFNAKKLRGGDKHVYKSKRSKKVDNIHIYAFILFGDK